MSKEAARQIISKRFADFNGLVPLVKAYPNQPKRAYPLQGFHAALTIDFVLHNITSIGEDPCTERVGTISLEVSTTLDSGTKGLTELTDALEEKSVAENNLTSKSENINLVNVADFEGTAI